MKAGRLIIAAAMAMGMVTLGTAAHAAEKPVQDRVNEVLADFPGGVQTGPGEVSWDSGSIVLTLEDATGPQSSVGSCESGHFCAFTRANMIGARISFTSCTATNSVAPLGNAVRSFANARSSGTVHAYNGTSSVDSVTSGNWTNTSATITRLGC